MNTTPLPRSAWALVARWLMACALMACASLAMAQANLRNFDHVKTGFPLTGVHANERCESCHVNGVFKGTPRDCATCHAAGSPLSRTNVIKPPRHIPTTQGCDSCHTTQTFTGARFTHTGVAPGTCQTCHNGFMAPGKSAGHIATQASCDSCHRTGAWTPATGFDHASVVPGTCGSCHNGARATGKPVAHMPVAASPACDSCHSTGNWRPTRWNHTQTGVTNQCSTCHSGAYPPADGRPANHVPYQTLAGVPITNCDSCHRSGYAAWAPARVHSNVSISMQCASCHTGSYPPAVGRPNTAIHVGATVCETCHRSTATWASARVDHSTFTAATNCTTCHNGSTATGKPAAHIPVAATNCISCHSTTTWRPTSWNHTQVVVTNQCSTCHSGAYPPADGRPTAHIPYQLIAGAAITNCDSCHRSGYAAWTPARFHSNVSVSTQCATCHTGSYPPAVGRPNTAVHVGVTVCESCHRSTTSWTSVTFAHSPANAVGTGTCDTCHNGGTARGKPTTHIPVTTGVARCDSCHRSQASWASAVTMNHTVVASSTCRSCHNGSYTSQGTVGALAKPANHIPEAQLLNGTAMDCNACHTGTTSWGTVRMNHNASQGNGSGWCKSCHASGTNFLGNMDKEALTHERRTPAPTDCSQSGCHRPLGSRGTPYTRW